MGQTRVSTKGRVAPLLAGVVLGALMIAPASAHFSQNTEHLGNHAWKQTIRERVYTKVQSDRRFPRQAVSGRKTVDFTSLSAGGCGILQIEPMERTEGAVVLVTAGPHPLNGLVLHGVWMSDTEPPHSWVGARICNYSASSIDPPPMTLDWQVLRG